MAYVNPLDPATPADSDPAAGGDDAIRQLKAALIERLKTVFPNFPDGDPLTYSLIDVGLAANRPNPPTAEGQAYYATDENAFYVAQPGATAGTFEWSDKVGAVSTGAASSMIWHLIDQAGLASTHLRIDSAPFVMLTFTAATATSKLTLDLNRVKDTRFDGAASTYLGRVLDSQTFFVRHVSKVSDGTTFGKLEVTIARYDGAAVADAISLTVSILFVNGSLATAVNMA